MLLSLPVVALVLHHYLANASGLTSTGFLMSENVLYMSYAHQYLDQSSFSLFYSNPFDGNPDSPNIYFQPVTIIFAGLVKAGIDPGLCFSLFGICAAIACIYMAIKILDHVLPQFKYLGLVALLFTWGGGLTSVTGLLINTIVPSGIYSDWFDGMYMADPAGGWWGLNWGRTLFIPLEAWYHFLFLVNIYLVLRQKWVAGIFFTILLSISHPFTGIEFLLIMIGWVILEKILNRQSTIPVWYIISLFAITAFHAWYYLIYLTSFPEHNLIFSQYSASWTYSMRVVIPAYCLVFALALLTLYLRRPLSKINLTTYQRLFLCWTIIAFLLSKHEWFMKPMQPIHFTRGYVWAGLFLFSLPGLTWLINYLQITKARKWLLYGFILVFLSDNLLWTANNLRGKARNENEGHLAHDTREVLNYLKKEATPNDLLTGTATLVKYIANVYTPANSWATHPYNTPRIESRKAEEMKFLTTGNQPEEWNKRRIIIVMDKKEKSIPLFPALKKNVLMENNSYVVFTP